MQILSSTEIKVFEMDNISSLISSATEAPLLGIVLWAIFALLMFSTLIFMIFNIRKYKKMLKLKAEQNAKRPKLVVLSSYLDD